METILTPKTPEVVDKDKQPEKIYHVVIFCNPEYVKPVIFEHVLVKHLGYNDMQVAIVGVTVLLLGSAVLCTTTKDIAETMVETANNCPLVKQTEFLKFVVKCQH